MSNPANDPILQGARVANKYIDEWTRQQLIIWREKIERLGIIRSGALHESLSSEIKGDMQSGKTIFLKFWQYGIFQALGTGRGYARDNGGDLEFLDKEYREQNRLNRPRKVGPAWGDYKTSGKPRERRDWYSAKLYMSLMALREDLIAIMGQTACNTICEALADAHAALVTRR